MLRMTLDSGLELLSVARPWSPLVAVRLCVRVGSAHDAPDEPGLAHLTEHLVLRHRHAGGYGVDAWTTKDLTVYSRIVHRADAVGAAAALLETVFNSPLDTDALTDELAAIEQERAHRGNDPRWRLREALLSRLWRSSPYARPVLGDAAALERLGDRRVRAFRENWYVPGNAVLALVGDTPAFDAAAGVGQVAHGLLTPGAPAHHRPVRPVRPARSDTGAVTAAEPPGTVGIAFADGSLAERSRALRDLAAGVVRALTGTRVHQVRVPRGGATWVTHIGRRGADVGDVVATLRLVERLLRSGGCAAVLADTRILELRRSELLEDAAVRVVDGWVHDGHEYDAAQRQRWLAHCAADDVAAAVAELRCRCENALASRCRPAAEGAP